LEIIKQPWFIGIGSGVIAGIIVALIFRARRKRIKPRNSAESLAQFEVVETINSVNLPQQTEPLPDDEPSSGHRFMKDLTPVGILTYLDSISPGQRQEAAKNYIGIRVSWGVVLSDYAPCSKRKTRIQMRSPEDTFYVISCTIDTSLYPELRVIDQSCEFIVEGEIESVYLGLGINLNNCRLLF